MYTLGLCAQQGLRSAMGGEVGRRPVPGDAWALPTTRTTDALLSREARGLDDADHQRLLIRR
jgi:hypothetical protein